MGSRLFGIFKRRRIDPECEEVRELSSDYIDGELEGADAVKARSHLERCGPCNAFINTLRVTVNLLRSSPKRQAQSDFRQRVLENLQSDRRR